MSNHRAARNAGFTLPELLLLIIVFAVGLAGILLVFQNTVIGSAEPIVRKQAMAAAESMLEEVMAMPFENPTGGWSGASTQANRTSFDDVQDYAGFATTGIYVIDGSAPIGGLESYSLAVGVSNAALGSAPAADSLRVAITVSGPRIVYVLEGYKLKMP